MTADKSLITRVVASLLADAALPIPILHSWDMEPEKLPYIVVSADAGSSAHRLLKTIDLRIDLLTNRDDTSEVIRVGYQDAISDHISAYAKTIAIAIMDDEWQTRSWFMLEEFSDPSDKREWSSGLTYRLVLMELIYRQVITDSTRLNRLVRPASDTTTVNLIDSYGNFYNIEPL